MSENKGSYLLDVVVSEHSSILHHSQQIEITLYPIVLMKLYFPMPRSVFQSTFVIGRV